MAELHVHTLSVRHHHITCDSPALVQHGMGHGAYDMVSEGERRHYLDAEGPVYEALEDTSYSPDAYPVYWRKDD